VKEEDENSLLDEMDRLEKRRDSSPAPLTVGHPLAIGEQWRKIRRG
jgi:hypothetical protein